jgi:hypothetical protein
MNKLKHRLLTALVIALLAIPTVIVFAKELGTLTVSGPGIKGEMTVTDSKFTLEQTGFFDQALLSDPPKNINRDAGYSITAHLNLDGRIVPYAEMVYYPTQEGQAGYVHYTGRLQGETFRSVDEWHILNRSADAAFRALMTANNVTFQSALVAASVKSEVPAAPAAEAAVVPVTSSAPVPTQSSYIIFAVIVAILLLVGTGLVVRRHNLGTAS